MRTRIFCLFTGLLGLLFCPVLQGQSSENDLDQAKLFQQFEGDWKAQLGGDTTMVWRVTAHGEGYKSQVDYLKGKTPFLEAEGIVGFTWNFKEIHWYSVWKNGMLARDLGKFTDERTLEFQRYTANRTPLNARASIKFESDGSVLVYFKTKKKDQAWDQAKVEKFHFTKEK